MRITQDDFSTTIIYCTKTYYLSWLALNSPCKVTPQVLNLSKNFTIYVNEKIVFHSETKSNPFIQNSSLFDIVSYSK